MRFLRCVRLRERANKDLWVQTSRTKAPPEGFDEIEDILEEYNRKMRDGADLVQSPRGSKERVELTERAIY